MLTLTAKVFSFLCEQLVVSQQTRGSVGDVRPFVRIASLDTKAELKRSSDFTALEASGESSGDSVLHIHIHIHTPRHGTGPSSRLPRLAPLWLSDRRQAQYFFTHRRAKSEGAKPRGGLLDIALPALKTNLFYVFCERRQSL